MSSHVFSLDFITAFVLENVVAFAVIGGVIFGSYILYIYLKPQQRIPDFIKIFKMKALEDESLNRTDALSPQWLYRGNVLLGKILTDNTQTYNSLKKPELEHKRFKDAEDTEEKVVMCITYRKGLLGNNLFIGKKQILRFLKEEAIVSGRRLIFPSSTSFTSLGDEYVTVGSYPVTSRIIEDNWNKRMHEAGTNAYANQMLKVSGLMVDYAQERKLRQLEIEKEKEMKKLKMGNII